jgi:hypothetical protein
MESAILGRSACPACGYPVKYRWMGHGNGDLMVNPDGTPHKDSCPAEAFREIRKRVMKSPRAVRALKGPPLAEIIPSGTREQILDHLMQPLQRKQSCGKTPPTQTDVPPTGSADATGQMHEGCDAAEFTQVAESAQVVESAQSPVQAIDGAPLKPEAATPSNPGPSSDLPSLRRTKREGTPRPEAPKRPRGRPRRDPAVAASAKEKPKAAQREIARCPACAVPLITDLNTGAQVCLTCNYQLEVVVETADV